MCQTGLPPLPNLFHNPYLLTLTNSQGNNLAMWKKSCTFRLWEGGSYTNKNGVRHWANVWTTPGAHFRHVTFITAHILPATPPI